MYKCNYFELRELVPESIFELMGDGAWGLFDERLLELIDDIRDHFGLPMVVNNWAHEGEFQFRGYRPQGCGVGSPTGAHYKGKAVDFNIIDKGHILPSETVSSSILKLRRKFPELRGVEIVNGWSHVDTMIRPGQKGSSICVFSPQGFVKWA